MRGKWVKGLNICLHWGSCSVGNSKILEFLSPPVSVTIVTRTVGGVILPSRGIDRNKNLPFTHYFKYCINIVVEKCIFKAHNRGTSNLSFAKCSLHGAPSEHWSAAWCRTWKLLKITIVALPITMVSCYPGVPHVWHMLTCKHCYTEMSALMLLL